MVAAPLLGRISEEPLHDAVEGGPVRKAAELGQKLVVARQDQQPRRDGPRSALPLVGEELPCSFGTPGIQPGRLGRARVSRALSAMVLVLILILILI